MYTIKAGKCVWPTETERLAAPSSSVSSTNISCWKSSSLRPNQSWILMATWSLDRSIRVQRGEIDFHLLVEWSLLSLLIYKQSTRFNSGHHQHIHHIEVVFCAEKVCVCHVSILFSQLLYTECNICTLEYMNLCIARSHPTMCWTTSRLVFSARLCISQTYAVW